MAALGDFDASTVVYGKFTTFRPSTGAAFTLAGTPAISVYKDNSTTQSTTGVTLTADFDSVTGLNHFAIDTSADGTFYSAGSFFDIVITTGTVDSISVVGAVVASFTIRKNSALKPATAGRTIVVDASGLADATAVKVGPTGAATAQTARDVGASVLLSTGTGTGQLDFTSGVVKANLAQILGTALTETAGQIAGGFKKFFNIATPASTMDALTLVATATNLTNASTAGDFTATMKTSIGTAVAASAVASVTGNVGGNVTGSVGSVVGAVGSVTGAVGSVTGAVGSVTGLTASDVGAIKTQTDKFAFTVTNQVDANVLDWKSATAPAMTGDAYARIGVAGAGLTALGDTRLAHLDADVSSVGGGSAPTAAEVADAVWDEATSGHTTSGTTGKALTDAQSSGDPWSTVIETGYTAADVMRILAAVAAGKDSVVRLGDSRATVTFRAIDDSADRIVANVSGSQRTAVTLTP